MVGDKIKSMMMINKTEKDAEPKKAIDAVREHITDLEGGCSNSENQL